MSDKTATARAKAKKGAREAIGTARDGIKKVRGISTNPATNALIADVAVLSATALFRKGIERVLKGLEPAPAEAENSPQQPEPAKKPKSSKVRTFVTARAASTATKSVPGLLVVSGGLLAKAIFDRGRNRRNALRAARSAKADGD